ncbi:MAG TPA: hypothetical protein ENH20_00265 [Candidatus Pacearchaeota archaeon]|nr:hypothetical protein [Candidatus Pacearchaeota archaeon]
MGGGSYGCGIHENGKRVALESSVNGKTVLHVSGNYNVAHFHEDISVIDWTSGGTTIGINGLPLSGKRTLFEQKNIFYDCLSKRLPDSGYDINVKHGSSDLR